MSVLLLFQLFNQVLISCTRPNFVVLFADDMGYGDLSCTGHPTIQTPNIDRLASEGTRFTQWYSGFHVCSPSRAALLTGRLPIRSGTVGVGWLGGVLRNIAVGGLPTNETTFAEVLRDAGYATAMAGKWHLGQRHQFLPTSRGFQEYLGVPYSVDMGCSAYEPFSTYPCNQQDLFFPPLPLMNNYSIIEQPVDMSTLSQKYVNFAVDFINRQASSKTPFLFYYSFNHVHVPDFASKSKCGTSLRGEYGDAMSEMDDAIGQVLDTLKKTGLEDNTVVFFTSDNGPWLIMGELGGSAGLLYEGKTTTWEGGVRVPGIVRWPGKVKPGTVNPTVVATYDLFPTMLSLAGVPLPTDRVYDGKDISNVFLNGAETPHKCIFHWKGWPQGPSKPGLWAVRCGAYKAHYVTITHLEIIPRFHDPPLLFNIEHDPSEKYSINSSSNVYRQQISIINAAKAAHESSIEVVTNQNALGTNPDFAICKDPQSQLKYPQYPNCTSNPENFESFVCHNTQMYSTRTLYY